MTSHLRHLLTSNLLCQVTGKRKISQLAPQVRYPPAIFDSQRFQDLLNKKQKLIAPAEIEAWRSHLPQIIQDLTSLSGFEVMPETNSWMEEVIKYNTPHGKGIRAFQVILADKYLSNDTSPENMHKVHILAWLIELGQAAACVVDDIMDESDTRRDRLCWYKVNNQGMGALNDGLLLLNSPFMLMPKYFGNTTYYTDLVDLYSFIVHAGMYGECRDVRNATQKNYEMYNMEFYKSMMRFKNGYYTFYSPVATSMIKNGIKDLKAFEEVEELSLDIGLIYSIQDDFMDCFVDPKLMGKIGTDIEEGKCTWLFVNALEKCSANQRQVLLKNYGDKDQDKVAVVKNLYREIGIPELFQCWEQEILERTCKQVEQLSVTALHPLFYDLLATLIGRNR